MLTFAATAYALQQTMVVPALPELQRELDASTAWVTWVMTGFLLAAAVLTPILGKLGDRFGKERLLVFSLGLFLLGCIGCAAAPDIWTLIAFRMVSGAAGAVFPLSFGIIRDEFPPEKMKVGIGLLSAVFGVGGGLGLVLSGLIVDHLSWRWIFVVGAIGVAVALLLVRRFVPESPVRSTSRIDVPGAVLLSVSWCPSCSRCRRAAAGAGARPPSRPLRALRRLARRLDRSSSSTSTSRSSTSASSQSDPCS